MFCFLRSSKVGVSMKVALPLDRFDTISSRSKNSKNGPRNLDDENVIEDGMK